MNNRRKPVRLHDIAAKAGISVNTVSRALRNRSDVSENTRQTVLALAKELGYNFPEQPASITNTITIGVLINDILNPFYAKMVQGIETVLWQHRANFLFQCSYREASKEHDILSFFGQQGVDGLLITSAINPEAILDQVHHFRIPAVFLSQRFKQYAVDYVVNDSYEGALMATTHLIKLGHRQIAFIADIDPQSSSYDRFQGYQAAFQQADLAPDPKLLRSGDKTIESGYYLTKDLLHSGETFTAVFTHNDLMALGALRAIKEAGLKVPANISLVGYDDILFAEFFDVPLTTVHQPILEISRKATELLFEDIKNSRSEHGLHQIILKPHLAVRSSTSICPRQID